VKGAEWNVILSKNGPIKPLHHEDGMFPVLKGGKAVLKELVMSIDHLSSNNGSGT